MKRFRVPTIPNMGMFISKREGEPFQTCDSAIFADAEEESPRAEKRPSAPHFSGLRRRNANHEQSRFMDAIQNENPVEKRPSATTTFKTLRSLSSSEIVHANDLKEHNEPQVTIVQIFAGAAHDSKSSLQNENKFFQENQDISASSVVEPMIDPQRDNSCQETILCQSNPRQTEEMAQTSQPGNESSNVVTKTFTLTTKVRHIEVLNPFRKLAEKIRALHCRLSQTCSQNTIPRLQENTRIGFAIIVTNIALVFNFLRCCFEQLPHVLAAIKVKKIRTVTERNEAPLPAGIPAISSSDVHGDTLSRSTDTEEDVVGQFGSVNTNVSTDVSSMGIDPPEINGENPLSAHSSQKSTRSNPEQPLYPPAPTRRKNFGTLSSDMTEEMMTAVPHIPSLDPTSDNSLREEEIVYEGGDKTNTQQHAAQINSERKIDSQGITDGSPQSRLSAKGDTSESPPEYFSQERNAPEDLMDELDQSSMRFEHKASEIIISPLNPTSPAFLSDGDFDTENRRRMKYPHGEVPVLEKPVRLSTEIHQIAKSTFSRKKRNSRGPTGKLRTDARTMKDSIFRAFGRNKAEPETRFASPRSARKTLALIADMLVKEYGCNVAVRRNGALKMRCEKIFTGNQRLKVRLAFQPLDAYSCNVIICRSREDEHHISTTDYVGFVADVQRSFLNATSEAMLGTDSGI